MANYQRGIGAALGTFARVLAGQRAARAEEEERRRQEEQRQQEILSRLIGASPTTSSEAAGLAREAASRPIPGAGQVAQQFRQEEQRIGRSENRKKLDEYLERVRAGERVADIFPGDASRAIGEETPYLESGERDEAKLGLLQQQMRTARGERETKALEQEKLERERTDQRLQEEAAQFARNRETREQARFEAEQRGDQPEDQDAVNQELARKMILSVGGIGDFGREAYRKALSNERITAEDMPDPRAAEVYAIALAFARDRSILGELTDDDYRQAVADADRFYQSFEQYFSGGGQRRFDGSAIVRKLLDETPLSEEESKFWDALSAEDKARFLRMAQGGG